MLTYCEVQDLGATAVVVDPSCEKPFAILKTTTHDEGTFNIEIEYTTPDLDREIDASFYAAAGSMAALESGALMGLLPFLIPDLFLASVRDAETAELIDRIVELQHIIIKRYQAATNAEASTT